MARVAGLDYAALIARVLDAAFARKPMLSPERWADAQRLSGVVPPPSDAMAREG